MMLDMGTGTGAIVISLLHQFEKLHGIGLDVSDGALTMARINAALNGVTNRFAALKSDWFSNVNGRFHLIVSNPLIFHMTTSQIFREKCANMILCQLWMGSGWT